MRLRILLVLLPVILLCGCITFPSTAVQSVRNLESGHRSTTQSFTKFKDGLGTDVKEKYKNDEKVQNLFTELEYFETTLKNELESIRAIVDMVEKAAKDEEDK